MLEENNTIVHSDTDLKSDRLNDEVILFMGCTLNETMMVLFISFIIALMVGMPLMLIIFDSFTLSLAVSLILLAPILLVLLMKLSRLKRGKPAGYYHQYIKIRLSKLGLINSPYIMRSGKWSTERIIK